MEKAILLPSFNCNSQLAIRFTQIQEFCNTDVLWTHFIYLFTFIYNKVGLFVHKSHLSDFNPLASF